MSEKKEIIAYCLDSVNKRIVEINLAINDADKALAEDTKSSAGDKYETSREMIQQDINRYQSQLVVAQNDLDILSKIDAVKQQDIVGVGSLIQTDLAIYFISISIGAVKLENRIIYVISALSPIGKVLIGKRKGDIFTFNGKEQRILALS